ncbi:hypothetical protein HNY73_015583 [Argiope bruennichi]|uniref:Uncharacterized protein n=1 Tax=Argiope bruennichi TaxID=94029 RepID=A0A8T0ESH5_ARGBR|nr:hypothetical protein HNY73_015583 [Argiope bruennichi]
MSDCDLSPIKTSEPTSPSVIIELEANGEPSDEHSDNVFPLIRRTRGRNKNTTEGQIELGDGSQLRTRSQPNHRDEIEENIFGQASQLKTSGGFITDAVEELATTIRASDFDEGLADAILNKLELCSRFHRNGSNGPSTELKNQIEILGKLCNEIKLRQDECQKTLEEMKNGNSIKSYAQATSNAPPAH